jgi:hypothetical protein
LKTIKAALKSQPGSAEKGEQIDQARLFDNPVQLKRDQNPVL